MHAGPMPRKDLRVEAMGGCGLPLFLPRPHFVPNRKGAMMTKTMAWLHAGLVEDMYDNWPAPDCILSDGPYGLGIYPGEPRHPHGLAQFYAPHAQAWARASKPSTTLWFWNSEIGWALSHPALAAAGWVYEETVIWDKGLAHIAGKVNSKTIRGLPVATEITVRYTRRPRLSSPGAPDLDVKSWLRAEWRRSGLPMSQANQACATASAATRKYLTGDDLWYWPPGAAVVAMAQWCASHGAPTMHPYFSLDGITPPTAQQWDNLRPVWNHQHGLTNVWAHGAVSGRERLRVRGAGVAHANQKPLALMGRQIGLSTYPGAVVWEPFGGLMTGVAAAVASDRKAYGAEQNPLFFTRALARISEICADHGKDPPALNLPDDSTQK